MSSQGFLSRWSQRKLDTKTDAPEPPAPVVEVVEEEPTEFSLPQNQKPNAEDIAQQDALVADLPDIDSLTEDSDFSVFMKQGVPQKLQELALRKLWRSSPVFANLDGLNDYDEDFSVFTPLAEGVADQLKQLMKENSRSEPLEEEETEKADEAEGTEKAPLTEQNDPPIDDEDDIGEGEDDGER